MFYFFYQIFKPFLQFTKYILFIFYYTLYIKEMNKSWMIDMCCSSNDFNPPIKATS